MVAQKHKKNCWQKCFCIFEGLPTQNPTNQIPQPLDSSRPYARLIENQKNKTKQKQKKGALRNYFCLKMISKIAPQKTSQENIHILEAWKPTKDKKSRLFRIF